MVLSEEGRLYAEKEREPLEEAGYLMASWGPEWLSEPLPVPASHVDKCQAVVSLILSITGKPAVALCF